MYPHSHLFQVMLLLLENAPWEPSRTPHSRNCNLSPKLCHIDATPKPDIGKGHKVDQFADELVGSDRIKPDRKVNRMFGRRRCGMRHAARKIEKIASVKNDFACRLTVVRR